MGSQWPKHPYVIFILLSFANISVFVLSIFIYVNLLGSAANLAMCIVPLVIPISAFAFGYYNITTHLREIKLHLGNQVKKDEKVKPIC